MTTIPNAAATLSRPSPTAVPAGNAASSPAPRLLDRLALLWKRSAFFVAVFAWWALLVVLAIRFPSAVFTTTSLATLGSIVMALTFAFSGEVTATKSKVRRGHFGEAVRCSVCREEVHDIGEMCSKQKTGQCDVCGPVLLDYYGCPNGGPETKRTHRIVGGVHPTTEREWLRMRILRLCCERERVRDV